jgi:hypothetical protein
MPMATVCAPWNNGCGAFSALGANRTVTLAIDPGTHSVLLTGVAPNCSVTGANPVSVNAVWGETGIQFAVTCAAVTLHLTTTTTGVSIDPDGDTLCIDEGGPWGYDCGSLASIGVNGAVSVTVPAGIHWVELDGVAPNCVVSGDNGRLITANVDTEVPFEIACAATGSVRVSAATTRGIISRDVAAAVPASRTGAPR